MDMDDVKARGLVLLGCGKMGSAMLAGWRAVQEDASTRPSSPPRSTLAASLAASARMITASMPSQTEVAASLYSRPPNCASSISPKATNW